MVENLPLKIMMLLLGSMQVKSVTHLIFETKFILKTQVNERIDSFLMMSLFSIDKISTFLPSSLSFQVLEHVVVLKF